MEGDMQNEREWECLHGSGRRNLKKDAVSRGMWRAEGEVDH
jgi:hypothetical protein